jgi:hypothetical protein
VRGGRWTILGYRGRVVLRTSARELGCGVNVGATNVLPPSPLPQPLRASETFHFNNDLFPIRRLNTATPASSPLRPPALGFRFGRWQTWTSSHAPVSRGLRRARWFEEPGVFYRRNVR